MPFAFRNFFRSHSTGNSIVLVVAARAHRTLKIMAAGERARLYAGKAEPRTIRIGVTHLTNWRRVSTHRDRYPDVFFSALCLAATIVVWLCVLSPPPARLL